MRFEENIVAFIFVIQRTFIRNAQQLSCCFNLRALRLLKKDTQKDSLTTDLQRIE